MEDSGPTGGGCGGPSSPALDSDSVREAAMDLFNHQLAIEQEIILNQIRGGGGVGSGAGGEVSKSPPQPDFGFAESRIIPPHGGSEGGGGADVSAQAAAAASPPDDNDDDDGSVAREQTEILEQIMRESQQRQREQCRPLPASALSAEVTQQSEEKKDKDEWEAPGSGAAMTTSLEDERAAAYNATVRRFNDNAHGGGRGNGAAARGLRDDVEWGTSDGEATFGSGAAGGGGWEPAPLASAHKSDSSMSVGGVAAAREAVTAAGITDPDLERLISEQRRALEQCTLAVGSPAATALAAPRGGEDESTLGVVDMSEQMAIMQEIQRRTTGVAGGGGGGAFATNQFASSAADWGQAMALRSAAAPGAGGRDGAATAMTPGTGEWGGVPPHPTIAPFSAAPSSSRDAGSGRNRDEGNSGTGRMTRRGSAIVAPEELTCVYKGEYNSEHLRHGKGTIRWDNGDVYEGQFQNGMRHGLGKLMFGDGSNFDGWWKFNKMHGNGTRHFKNGSMYTGPYVNGKRTGRGQHVFTNGDQYVGDFREDSMDGFGRYYFRNNNESFEGNFKLGKKEGKGKYEWGDGTVDIVQYSGDVRVGEGVRFSSNRKKMWKLEGNKVKGKISQEKANRIIERLSRMT